MSSQQQVSISFSSADRNRARWPSPSCYEVRLPTAVQRVRQVVLGAIDLPLNQNQINCEREARLPLHEGCVLRDNDDDEVCGNTLEVCEEGGGRAVLALPLPCQEVHAFAGEDNVWSTACPHGFHCNPVQVILVLDDGSSVIVPPCSITATSCTEFAVDSGVLDSGATVTHAVTGPLHLCEMLALLEAQLRCGAPHTLHNRYRVQLDDDDGHVVFAALGEGLAFQVSAVGQTAACLGLAPPRLHACPDSNGCMRARSESRPPVMYASIKPGTYDAQSCANKIIAATNRLFMQGAQRFVVRSLARGMAVCEVRGGLYTYRNLAREIERAIRAAVGMADLEPRVEWDADARVFRFAATAVWSLCLHIQNAEIQSKDLLAAVGMPAIEHAGSAEYRGRPLCSTLETRYIYKMTGSPSCDITNGYQLSVSEYVCGDTMTHFEMPSEATADTIEAFAAQFGAAVAQLGADVDISVAVKLASNGTYLVHSRACPYTANTVLRVCLTQSSRLYLAQVIHSDGFILEVRYIGAEPPDPVSTARVHCAAPPRFELPFAGRRDCALVRRLGFRHTHYRCDHQHTSDTCWDFDKEPFILMQLGTPKSGAPWKFYCSPDGKMVPYFAVLGTSSRYSRVYQDTADFKTSGTTTVGTIRVEFLRPDLTPYDFKGCDHLITLVFVTEGDQAVLSCI